MSTEPVTESADNEVQCEVCGKTAPEGTEGWLSLNLKRGVGFHFCPEHKDRA